MAHGVRFNRGPEKIYTLWNFSRKFSSGEARPPMRSKTLSWTGGMRKRLTFAIGDIHGCFEELTSLIQLCSEAAGAAAHDFVLLGDYVDRGPQSSDVIEDLMRRH